jgi:hypothetical protein
MTRRQQVIVRLLLLACVGLAAYLRPGSGPAAYLLLVVAFYIFFVRLRRWIRSRRPARRIRCAEHGETDIAFVCAHLAQAGAQSLGFYWTVSKEPVGWCDACERVHDFEGEWNARAKAALGRMHPLCSSCFERLRYHHFRQLPSRLIPHHDRP